MMTKINKAMNSAIKGQAALILVLLSAVGLIMLAITLNWGRIAQNKVMITIAADQSAALLGSYGASYGEMEKQSNLNDTNQLTFTTSVVMAIITFILSFIAFFIPFIGVVLACIIVAMALLNLVLQVVVVQPMITNLWNKAQRNQPVQQQFFEAGMQSALMGSIGDQVNVTDYMDWNSNGIFGSTAGTVNDTIGRFALFYSERQKMISQPVNPAVLVFYTKLGELMGGATCGDSQRDNYNFGSTVDPACVAANVQPFTNSGSGPCTPSSCSLPSGSRNCVINPIDVVCAAKIPNGFQLNDSCTDGNPGSSSYNPYCDPCCAQNRPSSCGSAYPGQCATNNPYGASYPYLYDPGFQEFANDASFLDKLGRDQQTWPGTPPALTPTVINAPNGPNPGLEFPNGIFPLFWMMKDFSPEVDNINPSSGLSPAQAHWCSTGAGTGPAGFQDLAPLNLQYSCSGQDCCVNYLDDGTSAGAGPGGSAAMTISVGAVPTVSVPTGAGSYNAGQTVNITDQVSEAAPGSIASVNVTSTGPGLSGSSDQTTASINPALPATSAQITASWPVTTCNSSTGQVLGGPNNPYTITVTATDTNGNSARNSTTITINNPNVCSATNNCGYDSCGKSCGDSPPTSAPGHWQCVQSGSNTVGTWVCTPTVTCGAHDCGQDNCGNICGTGSCPSPDNACTSSGAYNPGSCYCIPTNSCSGYNCGADSCNTSCGNCTGKGCKCLS